MGRLSDERIYETCMVKTTFDAADAAPPPPAMLRRACTEPLPSCASHASTHGGDSPRSLREEFGGCLFSQPSSPQSTAEGSSPLSHAAGTARVGAGWPAAGGDAAAPSAPPSPPQLPVPALLDLAPAAPQEVRQELAAPRGADWVLRVRGTFLEYHWSPKPIRRSSSTGDLAAVAEAAQRSREADASPVAESQATVPPRGASVAAAVAADAWQALAEQPVGQSAGLAEASPAACGTPDAAEWPVMFVYEPQPQPQPQVFDPSLHYGYSGWDAQASVPLAWPVAEEHYEPPAWTPRVEGLDGQQQQGGRRRGKRRGGQAAADGPAGGSTATDEAKFLQVIEGARQAALEDHPGQVWDLARRDRESSILVQGALRTALHRMQAAWFWSQEDYDWAVFDVQALLKDFSGHLLEALKHHHANHVVKLLMEVAPTWIISPFMQELRNHAVWAAKHNYGCRSILRLVQHCGHQNAESAAVGAVVGEVLAAAEELCEHEFGKFVIEELLRSALPEHRRRAVEALRSRGRLVRNAKHKHASGLIEKALDCVDVELGSLLVDELFSDAETVKALIRNQHGMYLLKDIMEIPRYGGRVRRALEPLQHELQESKPGRKLIDFLVGNDSRLHV